MSGIYIKGLKMPTGDNWRSVRIHSDGSVFRPIGFGDYALIKEAKAIAVPDHGELIDRDELNVTDSWEWIRYQAPTVIQAERSEDDR